MKPAVSGRCGAAERCIIVRNHASVEHVDWRRLAARNVERLKQAMREDELSAAVIGSMNNIHWLTGIPMTSDYPYFFSHIAVIALDSEEPLLLSPYVKEFFPEEREWLREVRELAFTKEIEDPTTLVSWHREIARALRDLGTAGGDLGTAGAKADKGRERIGVDPRLSIPLYEGIKNELPELEFVSISKVLSRARSVKGAEELKAIRQSCAAAELGLDAGIRAVKLGASEREIAGATAGALYSFGASGLGFMPNIVSGERPGILFSSGKRVRPNECVRVDISPAWGGYYSCLARTVFTGKPPPQVVDAYTALRETHEKALSWIKPGMTNYDLYARTKNELETLTEGAHTLPFFLGHGIGVSIIDEPWIFDSSCCEETKLEAGMCFLFEPIVRVRGFGDLALTDCAAVTETGVEVLTRSDRRLFLVE